MLEIGTYITTLVGVAFFMDYSTCIDVFYADMIPANYTSSLVTCREPP